MMGDMSPHVEEKSADRTGRPPLADFSLVAIVRTIIEETDLASPREISDKAVEMVPDSMLVRALVEAMPYVVQAELSRQPHGSMATGDAPARAANTSAKVAAIRQYADAWRGKLHHRISVGGGEWKFLADCAAVDFRTAANRRRAHAAGAIASAVEFESYAAACEQHKVSRFADLPESVQRELLGGEAATS